MPLSTASSNARRLSSRSSHVAFASSAVCSFCVASAFSASSRAQCCHPPHAATTTSATIGSAVRQLWGYAVAHGGTEPDVSTLIKHLEKWGGVEVKGRAAARGKGRGK